MGNPMVFSWPSATVCNSDTMHLQWAGIGGCRILQSALTDLTDATAQYSARDVRPDGGPVLAGLRTSVGAHAKSRGARTPRRGFRECLLQRTALLARALCDDDRTLAVEHR